MGGSKSKSSSSNTTTTKTNNLNLDGVEGVTLVSGAKNVSITETSDGAFDVVTAALDVIENNNAKALTTVADTTLGSFQKINESNQSETALLANKFTAVAVVGLGVWAIVKMKGK